jgi:dTDP-4-dehydrorhamnose 3,5-epimerase
MHFQEKPFEETKIVRCVKGKIFDVIIDLRSNSKTYKKWISIELNSNDLKMIYIPEGFAHGFQTLEDNTEVMYQMSNWFSPEHAKGIRWNDQEFDIKWPINEPIISKKDQLHELQNTRRE